MRGTGIKLVGYGSDQISIWEVLVSSSSAQNSQIWVGSRVFRVPVPSLVASLLPWVKSVFFKITSLGYIFKKCSLKNGFPEVHFLWIIFLSRFYLALATSSAAADVNTLNESNFFQTTLFSTNLYYYHSSDYYNNSIKISKFSVTSLTILSYSYSTKRSFFTLFFHK